MSAKSQITISKDELKGLIAEAVKQDREERDKEFQKIWRREGKDYASGIVTLLDGTKVWLNIFPNKYWEKKKKGEQPMFSVKFNEYTPKEK